MIHYYSQDVSFNLKGKRKCSAWLKSVAAAESRTIGEVSVIFCSDAYLLDVNKKYLYHDYYTDIITFDYCEGNVLSGDLFISVDSVRENASYYGEIFETELNRVIVHGILHLIGYDDHTEDDIAVMRSKESEYLKCRNAMM